MSTNRTIARSLIACNALELLLIGCSDPTTNPDDPCAIDNGGCGDPAYIICANNDEAPPTCSDIDECQTDNGGCGDPIYVICTNNGGATPTCDDIDECQNDNGGCGDAMIYRCTNVYGAEPQCELAYVLPPDPADTGDYLIGAFYMPAWNMNFHWAWPSIEDYPERTPLLGYYDEGNPEAMDWEIRWAMEHGVSFFIFDWFRNWCSGPCPEEPEPITVESLSLGHALNEGFLDSHYGDGDDPEDMKFAIMLTSYHPWNRIFYSEEDAEETLIPFLVDNYFSRPNYLTIDGMPLLFHYNSNTEVAAELETDERIMGTIEALRRATIDAGFPGLVLLAENRNPDSAWSYQRALDLGFDSLHNYVWGAPPYGPTPTDEEGILYQMDAMRSRIVAGVPFVVGATMGWDNTPLGPSETRWRLHPSSYNTLLRNIRTMMDEEMVDPLGRRMLIVGAWNELSEGHYIVPHEEYGFGYLEEIRAVFSDLSNSPDYRLPEEVGLGPYDALYQQYIQPRENLLVAHFPLDGDATNIGVTGLEGVVSGDPVVVSGVHGQAYDFDGVDDFISAPDDYRLEGVDAISFGAWINVDEFVTGGVAFEKDGGYRMVVSDGGASHCVVATKYHRAMYAPETIASFGAGFLDVGTWHHLLCVYDGSVVRAYVDGQVVGTSTGDLSGSIQTASAELSIGGRAGGTGNWFRGRIDDLRIWNYELSDEEVADAASR